MQKTTPPKGKAKAKATSSVSKVAKPSKAAKARCWGAPLRRPARARRTARSARAHVLARGAPTHAMQAFDKVVKSDKPASSKAKAKTKTAKPFA